MSPELNLRDLDWPALRAAVGRLGCDQTVARRIFARVHREGASSLEGIPGLTRQAREGLRQVVVFPDLEVLERRVAADGFVKYLFRLPDGPSIEAVRIPLPDPAQARALKERRRLGRAAPLEALPASKYSICVSSQAGCALACDFCATGRLGAIRSLAIWEILSQVRQIAAEAPHPVRGVVFMGMGEPFLNYDNVVRAAQVMCDPAGMAIAAKAITISTAGVVPMIRRFTAEKHRFRLSISLGAPSSGLRLALMPIERRWPLPELMEAIRAHAATTGDRVMLAYVAIGGLNVSRAHAAQLGDLVAGLRVKVSLIDVSDELAPGDARVAAYQPPSEDELREFRDELTARGIPVVRRYSGGKEIGAACGTLSASQRGGALVGARAGAQGDETPGQLVALRR